MLQPESAAQSGGGVSPGGFEFGMQGWHWGDPQPRSITFFLDNTAMVCDQYGRPIKGSVLDGKEVWFAVTPPKHDEAPGARSKLGTHAKVVDALTAERVEWWRLACAGWPQLPYDSLKRVYGEDLTGLPPTPVDELRKIRDKQLRRDALKARIEYDEARSREGLADDEDDYPKTEPAGVTPAPAKKTPSSRP